MNVHPLCIEDGYSSLSNPQNTLHCGSIGLRIYYNQGLLKWRLKSPSSPTEQALKRVVKGC